MQGIESFENAFCCKGNSGIIFTMANVFPILFDFVNKQPICKFNAMYHAT